MAVESYPQTKFDDYTTTRTNRLHQSAPHAKDDYAGVPIGSKQPMNTVADRSRQQ